MIINEQQLRATQKAKSDLQESLDGFDELKLIQAGIDPVLIRAQRVSIRSAIAELDEQIIQYVEAKEAIGGSIEVNAFHDLGAQMIKARIANGWTQRDLAERLGVKEQQVQRYEKERYRMASLERLTDVSRVLGVDLSGHLKYKLEPIRRQNSVHDFVAMASPDIFPIKEMAKRRWINIYGKISRDAASLALNDFFEHAHLRYMSPALYRRTDRPISATVQGALLAWQARVKFLAQFRHTLTHYKPLNADVVKHIATLTAHPEGPLKAVDVLAEHGIRIVFLKHLQGTLLDGASMLSEDGQPVIGMTLRLDRLDNFWHVLFHEIGHISRHWNCGLAEGFLDNEELELEDPREKEADEFARNALIPDEVWLSSFVRYATTASQVVDFANAVGVGPSVVAGRLRFDRKDYTIWGSLVGRGKVRKMFEEAGLLET